MGLNLRLIETKLVFCVCIIKGECLAPSALHGQNAVVPRSHHISGTGGNPVVKKPEWRPISYKRSMIQLVGYYRNYCNNDDGQTSVNEV